MPGLARFSRGLRIVRWAVLAMLFQVGLSILDTIQLLLADDKASAVDWFRYLFVAHGLIMLAMAIGAGHAIGELRRARLGIASLVVALVGFAVSTAIVAWCYEVLTAILHATSYGEVMARQHDLELFPRLAAVKTAAYGVALVAFVGTVERAAQTVDQIALRDEAGSMKRALIVMLGGDVFYQLTLASTGGIGFLGFGAELLIGGFWIYCHFRLAKFLFNASYLIGDDGTELPVATAVVVPAEPMVKPPPPIVEPPRPSGPVVVQHVERVSAPVPVAAPKDGDPPPDEPKLLR